MAIITGGGGNGGSSPFLVAKKTLTNTQIMALDATPIEVVAAQGSGTVIVPIFAAYVGTIVGSVTGGGKLVLALDAANNYNQMTSGIDAAFVLQATGKNIGVDGAPTTAVDSTVSSATDYAFSLTKGQTAAGFDNAALSVSLQSGSFSGGNAGNSLAVTVLYAVVSI